MKSTVATAFILLWMGVATSALGFAQDRSSEAQSALPGSRPSQSDARIAAADVDQRVVASLPTWKGRRAEIVDHFDLTQLFATRRKWTFVVAALPASRMSAYGEERTTGSLAECFVEDLTPSCKYAIARDDSSWYSIPVRYESAEVVYAGAHRTAPLLLVDAGSAHGGDGSHAIFTQLFIYDRQADRFKSVFSNMTGSNNNQGTRFVENGPLQGDVIVDYPTDHAPYTYWIEVYRQRKSGRYARIVRYRSRTAYGDGNPIPVIDSEMPEILRRLDLWRPGDPLPVPLRLPDDGCARLFMRDGEEWCKQPGVTSRATSPSRLQQAIRQRSAAGQSLPALPDFSRPWW